MIPSDCRVATPEYNVIYLDITLLFYSITSLRLSIFDYPSLLYPDIIGSLIYIETSDIQLYQAR